VELSQASLGLRVAQARQRANLTQDDLARLITADRSAIAKIETGTRRISALELARIAQAVGERIEWFVAEPIPAIVSHRNMTDPGEPSPQIDKVIDRAVRAVEFTAQHDDTLRRLMRPLPVQSEPTNATESEALASRARSLLGEPADTPLYGLSAKLANIGILTFAFELGTESADAGSVLLDPGAVVVINCGIRSGRRRLALAHEFGHVLIADEYSIDWRLGTNEAATREKNIDSFARALLLPRDAVIKEWCKLAENESRIREAAVRIASKFRVDMVTLAGRLLDLNLVNSPTAASIRNIRTNRTDIVEHNLIVADELLPGEIPQPYAAAVLSIYKAETVSEARALDLLLDTWSAAELPNLPTRSEAETWAFVS